MLLEPIQMSAEDVAALQELFADELARGWIPRRAEVGDALGLVRAQRADLIESLDRLVAL